MNSYSGTRIQNKNVIFSIEDEPLQNRVDGILAFKAVENGCLVVSSTLVVDCS